MFGGKTIKTGYQSDIDAFFHEFDEKRKEQSIARVAEINKFAPIFAKRDHPSEEEESKIWEGF
jgi:hypothetical protein